jgi:hypothetical protein
MAAVERVAAFLNLACLSLRLFAYPLETVMNLKTQLLSLGLVFAALVVSWLAGFVTGGFKIGRLERRVKFGLLRDELGKFYERFHQRLSEIGFRPGDGVGRYLQSGSESGDLSSYTHAKTRKQLTIIMQDTGPHECQIELALCFLDPIVGDTGESAYRDAVLDYVSGKSDAMRVVPNRSYAAFSSLVGGICAGVALCVFKAMHIEPLAPPITTLAFTAAVIGMMGIVAIKKRPGELTGLGLGVGGIILSTAAGLAAIILSVKQ